MATKGWMQRLVAHSTRIEKRGGTSEQLDPLRLQYSSLSRPSRMFPLSINELTTLRWSFEAYVLNCRSAFLSALAVWRPKLADWG